VIGDEKGRIGIGVAKGADVQAAISKAKNQAKKSIIKINLLDNRTIHHEIEVKYGAARVLLKPASDGHGLKAGGSIRTVLSLAGVKDITAKALSRTKNKLTNAKATIKALESIQSEK